MTFNDEDKVAKLSIPEKFEIILIYIDDFFSFSTNMFLCLFVIGEKDISEKNATHLKQYSNAQK